MNNLRKKQQNSYPTCMPRNVRVASSLPWPERCEISAPSRDFFFHLDLDDLIIFVLHLYTYISKFISIIYIVLYDVICMLYAFLNHQFLVFRAGSIACACSLVSDPGGTFHRLNVASAFPSRFGTCHNSVLQGTQIDRKKTWRSPRKMDQT